MHFMLQQEQSEELQAVVANASSMVTTNGNVQYVLQVFGKCFSFLVLFDFILTFCSSSPDIIEWKSCFRFMRKF